AAFNDSLDGTGGFSWTPDFTQSGIYNVTLIASDGALADSEVVTITVTESNRAPVLAAIGAQNITEGDTLVFGVSATDPDGTTPFFTVLNAPFNSNFMDSTNGNGAFTFRPDFTQSGAYPVTFIASDGALADTEVVSITVVEAGNQRPALTPIGNKIVAEGGQLQFMISAGDADLDSLVLTAVNVPLNGVFDDSGDGTGAFTFNPSFTQNGIYNVTFIASDGLLADSEAITITVTEAGNQPPAIDSIGPKVLFEGDTLRFRVHAVDPDGTIPSLFVTSPPPNSNFVDSGNGAGSFVFIPSFTQQGIHNVSFFASDGALTDVETVQITVNNVNLPPAIDSIGPKSVQETNSLNFQVRATDPDGAAGIVLTAINLPANASFSDSGNGLGRFIFNPDTSQAGIYNVTFIASDIFLADSEVVQITVSPSANHAPVLDPISPKIVTEGNLLEFRIHATDQDGSIPTISHGPLPRGAVVVDSGNGAGSFSWTPDFAQAGLYSVRITASDGALQTNRNVFIQVQDAGNQKPVLFSIGSRNVTEGQILTFNVPTADPDSTLPAVFADSLPVNAEFNDLGSGTGIFLFEPNFTQAGNYNVLFRCVDAGGLADSELVSITVIEAGNQTPQWLVIPETLVVNENSTGSFIVRANDPDSSIPLLRQGTILANSTFTDSANGTGLFQFTPSFSQSGTHLIAFLAKDSQDTTVIDADTVRIIVIDVNRKPVFTQGSIPDQTVNEGDSVMINLTVNDPDGTFPLLRYRPENASFVPITLANSALTDNGNGTGQFKFKPSFTQSGVYFIAFFAVDQVYSADTTFHLPKVRITVSNVNQAPVIANAPDTTITEGDSLEMLITSTDPDLTIPTLNASNMPSGALFLSNPNGTGRFIFKPKFNQSGAYAVRFIASDGVLADTEIVNLTVLDAGNHAPVITTVFPDSMIFVPNKLDSFTVRASDPDSTIPTISATGLPSLSTFSNISPGVSRFRFAPADSQTGNTYLVVMTASDGSAQDSDTLRVMVINFIRGDANGDLSITLADIIYIVNYLFKSGPAPVPFEAGDANNNGDITLADIVYLVNYLFKAGPPPPP
ncbi:MAG: Ig-like domain-containing protein, partial [candidate division Zixibacteria bacterium]|nr:Ig-like domain-containing protein [candidate division Zixibacteria bacterium]